MSATIEVTTPSDREVEVTRVFNAPASLIWDCHTKPALIRQWLLGPDGWTMPVCEVDLRVGGRYHYRWEKADRTEGAFGFNGTFKEITAPTRIVHTESMDDMPGEALITLTLAEKDGRTTLTVNQRFESKEVRDMAVGTGMTDGMATSYDRLEKLFVKQAA